MRRLRSSTLIFAGVVLLATPSLCQGWTGRTGQTRGIERVTAAEAPALALTVRVNGKAGRLLQALESGDTLTSGDLVEVVVATDRPAYVYLVQRFADGSAVVLHPESGDLQLQGGLETRLPEPGAWYRLDEATGEEHLYIVASEQPIGAADSVLAEALAEVRSEGTMATEVTAASTPKPPLAPQPTAPHPVSAGVAAPHARPAASRPSAPNPARLPFSSRGLVKAVEEGIAAIEADATGVAIYHFWFRHEPASAPEVIP